MFTPMLGYAAGTLIVIGLCVLVGMLRKSTSPGVSRQSAIEIRAAIHRFQPR